MSNYFSLLPEELHPMYLQYLSYLELKTLKYTCKFFLQSSTLQSELMNQQETIRIVCVGLDAAYVLFKDGRVMSVGNNLRGQLGTKINSSIGADLKLNKIIFPPQVYIEDLVVGYQHIFFRTICKKWYGCGSNAYQELYSGNEGDFFSPTLIKIFPEGLIQKIVAGKNVSFFKLENGEWYGVGNNSYGQLGVQHNQTTPIPQQIVLPHNAKIRNVFTKNSSTIFETEGGLYYGCGSNMFGELGLGHTNIQIIPVLIPFSLTHRIVRVVQGFFAHTFFQTIEGEWFSCGINRTGQLGLGHRNPQYTPALMKSPGNCRITHLSAGNAHTIIGDEGGNWFACGANKYGQLCINIKPKFPVFQLTPISLSTGEEINTAVAGGNSTFIKSANNSWYSFGEIKFILNNPQVNLCTAPRK